ncbi:MAG: hypothetical protein J6B39_03765 [Lachnospiraceae bacterium]|nr:hypothetical protein [Lachnospiraceae bacterium]
MNASIFRANFPTFEDELILNTCYGEGEDYRVLTMLARKNGKLYMWEISGISEEDEENRMRRIHTPRTNRAMHKQLLDRRCQRMISEVNISGQVLNVSCSRGAGLYGCGNDREEVLLYYFLLKGVRFGALERVPFERLWLTEYEIADTVEAGIFEKLRESDSRSISVTLREEHVQIPVNKRFKLKFGEYDKPKVLTINNGGEAEDINVYIHGVSRYDAWEEEKTRFDDPRYKENFDELQLEQLKAQHREAVSMMCPKEYVIPLIEYECDKDYQMQFYTSEYLKKEHQSTNKSVIMMFKSDRKNGPMGYLSRVCQLEAVPYDYDENMSVELFMYYKIIPAKTIECKPV